VTSTATYKPRYSAITSRPRKFPINQYFYLRTTLDIPPKIAVNEALYRDLSLLLVARRLKRQNNIMRKQRTTYWRTKIILLARHERWHMDGCACRQHWPWFFLYNILHNKWRHNSNIQNRRAYICCRSSIYTNSMHKVKARKMAAPLSPHISRMRVSVCVTSLYSGPWLVKWPMSGV
jgi:hypothetical protein